MSDESHNNGWEFTVSSPNFPGWVCRGRYVEPDNIEFLYNDECFSILTVPGYKIWNIPAHLEEYLGKLEALRLEVERPWTQHDV